ncbi:MAG: lactococcin 972 family bacteriocin [Pseudonocardiaceae bacterium]
MAVKRKLVTALAAGAMVLGFASPALATVAEVEGGTWDYGVGGGKVWSYYYHGSSCHKSSVQGQQYVSSGKTPAGVWARASVPDRWYTVDYSYYATC